MSPISSQALGHLSKNEVVQLLDLVQVCALCSTKDAFDRIVEGLKGLVPFEFFTCLSVSLDDGNIQEPFRLLNVNYDPEWIEIYQERRYHLVDPVLKENFRSFGVQYWADTYRKYPPDREFRGEAEHYRLCSGYTCGTRNLAGTRGGLLSFAGRDIKKYMRTKSILGTVTPHLSQAAEQIGCVDRLKDVPTLTDRERQVLHWTTRGKTAWETATILDIGERTVKFHMKNIMKKLGVVSRTHATAVASELGLVDPD